MADQLRLWPPPSNQRKERHKCQICGNIHILGRKQSWEVERLKSYVKVGDDYIYSQTAHARYERRKRAARQGLDEDTPVPLGRPRKERCVCQECGNEHIKGLAKSHNIRTIKQ